MDVLGHNLHHALHLAVKCLAASCRKKLAPSSLNSPPPIFALNIERKKGLTILKHHSHGSTLVQNAQLALGTLLVRRVRENTTVQQRSVGISNHASNISRAVRLATLLGGELQRVEVRLGVVLPVERVPLVDRVDGALPRHAHVGVGEDELAEGVVHGEAVDGATLHGDDELSGGAVHGEAGGDELGAGL